LKVAQIKQQALTLTTLLGASQHSILIQHNSIPSGWQHQLMLTMLALLLAY
jgi:hypothetical protein